MKLGVLVPLFLIVASLLAALLFHEELTQNGTAAAAEQEDLSDRLLSLKVGGKAPELVLDREPRPRPPGPGERPASKPVPGPTIEKDLGPDPLPQRERLAFLRKDETIYALCRRVLGSPRAYREVLRLNGWTEEQARKLKPGTTVRLPIGSRTRGAHSDR